jgi:outer membrane protein assembly factor BamB
MQRAGGRRAARPLAVLTGAALIGALGSGVTTAHATVRSLTSGHAAGRSAAGAVDWPAYLNGPLHTSYSPAQTAITPATAASLAQKWFLSGQGFLASPTVAGGAVYIGTSTGQFLMINEATGVVLHSVYIGRQVQKTCTPLGVVSTATIATDPDDHKSTVYVAGGDGYLYALDAASLKRRWRAVIALPSPVVSNYYDWSSPTVTHGKIYIGVASNCDHPLIRGGLIAYDQATGKQIAHFYTVPKGDIGGSIWSSAAVAPDGDVYATTGNGPLRNGRLGYSESILKLASGTLKLLGRFQVPLSQQSADGDFGASPVIFGPYVGACNKNGIFYLLRRSTMKVVWQRQIATAQVGGAGACLATPAYNGKDLFFAGAATTVDGTPANGSVQERDAATGQLIWITALASGVIGSPTMDGGGVLAVGSYQSISAPNAIYLIDAATGNIIQTLSMGTAFAQTVFANNWLFGATSDGVFAMGSP